MFSLALHETHIFLLCTSTMEYCNSEGQRWWRAGAGLGSKEEARLRDLIEGEVLDTRPSVRWKDVAGLSAAKQARPLSHIMRHLAF